MDDRTRPGLHPRLLAALGALLPDGLRDHPDAQALFDPEALPAVDEAALVVPEEALVPQGGKQFVFLLDEQGQGDGEVEVHVGFLCGERAWCSVGYVFQ